MKRTLSLALVLSAVTASVAQAAEHPCKPKGEARHEARKAVHECLNSWSRDGKPGTADPTDDCSSKVAAFVQAAKDFKACRAAQHPAK